jgi:carboxymethylenebutenolidase
MDQRIINLFDEYTHKPLSREEFLKRLAILTGSTAAALAALPFLEVNYAKAATIAQQDDRLETAYIQYQVGTVNMRGYMAKPKKKGKFAGVVVIHENRGLNPHIEDVTRRMALEGFVALAPDGLSPVGGTPTNADEARELFQKLDAQQTIENFRGAFSFLEKDKGCNEKFGCIGFCWGGAMANNLAIYETKLKASVPFYGRQPDLSLVKNIKAALCIHYAEMDERVNAGKDAYENALKEAGILYEQYVYAGAQHAFHNDTAPTRYNEAAAKLAWQRSIDFFKKYLG